MVNNSWMWYRKCSEMQSQNVFEVDYFTQMEEVFFIILWHTHTLIQKQIFNPLAVRSTFCHIDSDKNHCDKKALPTSEMP